MNDNTRHFRRDSYLNSLSGSDFAKALAILTQPGVSLATAHATVPPWGRGSRAGRRPSYVALSILRDRLRVIFAAIKAEIVCRAQIPPPKLATPSASELALLEQIALAAERIIADTFQPLNFRDRLAAARLLLRRADQRRAQIKMNPLHSPFRDN